MATQSINDFLPQEMRTFAEQGVRQAKQAFEELMAATQRAVSALEGQTSSVQANAREIQRKVITYSERNVAASLEFALHADYVKRQMQALTEQARHRPARNDLRKPETVAKGLKRWNCA